MLRIIVKRGIALAVLEAVDIAPDDLRDELSARHARARGHPLAPGATGVWGQSSRLS
jgi:hypothetical protein